MPSNVLVSGINELGTGTYTYDGELNGKPSYKKSDVIFIQWGGSSWTINVDGDVLASFSDVAYPWLATDWFGDLDPTNLVITEVPVSSENTFGLPADVVALITSRFGTVANFLRLRNQGQI